jgi:ATP-dependent helicase/nuclease subunit B
MTPRVFTIPPSVPFLPALIEALAAGRLVGGFVPEPLALADATIFLPTRRACRLARDAFLDVLKGEAVLLPRIIAIGDIDEDEFAFADAATGSAAIAALTLPPAIDGLERRLLLARLVRKWAEGVAPVAGEPHLVVRHPAAALALADDLARLMDDMATRQVPWQRLDALVPDYLDTYWQLTMRFLAVAREQWPAILAERGAIEPAERRDRLIAAETARLAAGGAAPVIAAGSTGSMPATAKLLATIAALPNGAVVLPGLDVELDDAAWNAISGPAAADGRPTGEDARPGVHDAGTSTGTPSAAGSLRSAPGHPQFAMQALLKRMGITRRDVAVLAPPSSPARPRGRETLASEALRPAGATDQWRARLAEPGFVAAAADAMAGITVIEAATAEEEALAIAIVLREAVTEPFRTAALVTPDRRLARRVAVTLQRWRVWADDSGGDPLAETAAGVFARLVAQVALDGFAPAPLLALLKHSLARFGADDNARAVTALERAILRGPRPRPGAQALAGALDVVRRELAKLRNGEACDIHRADPRAMLHDAALAAAQRLVAKVVTALAPLEAAAAASTGEFAELVACHRDAVEAASQGSDGEAMAFAGADGQALALAFAQLGEKLKVAPFPVAVADYGELFRTAIGDRVVRRPGAPGSRVRIYGPLEARLTSVDRVVIGALVEGVWPPAPHNDAWLSRPMRQALGLDLPERRIGLAAHDFAQLLGAREVFLTIPAKRGGAPAIASRFVQRLAAVAGPALWQEAVGRGERYRNLARSLDHPKEAPRPAPRPEPRPPRPARPAALSVTDIGHWLRDPYTIYAKYILRLPRLDQVDEALGAADRGSFIHAAVGDFARLYADELPADPYGELLRLGEMHFAHLNDFPEARAFWWPRYERIARWFAAFEQERRAGIVTALAEIRGEMSIATPSGGGFRLTGRADRIECLAGGRHAILDFKTGVPPTSPQVRSGLAPQLTLEAAMLRSGGFAGIAANSSITELAYVRLKGGQPAGERCVIDFKGKAVDAAADEALQKLRALVVRFDDEATPYRSLDVPLWKDRYGTYDDLARIKEWALSGGALENGD